MFTRNELVRFYNCINGLSPREYLLSLIAYGAAPTIVSDKPATLLSFSNSNKDIYSLWRRYQNEICHVLGLESAELGSARDHAPVLFYTAQELFNCIRKDENRNYLDKAGYLGCKSLDDYISVLKKRFQNDFPHEIGIFLGFPLHDVHGFMVNHGKNYLLSGYWKVYKNADSARRKFEAYDYAKTMVMKAILCTFSGYNLL